MIVKSQAKQSLGPFHAPAEERMAAEIERLRAALQTIADTKPHHAGQTRNEYNFQKLARETLGITPKEGE